MQARPAGASACEHNAVAVRQTSRPVGIGFAGLASLAAFRFLFPAQLISPATACPRKKTEAARNPQTRVTGNGAGSSADDISYILANEAVREASDSMNVPAPFSEASLQETADQSHQNDPPRAEVVLPEHPADAGQTESARPDTSAQCPADYIRSNKLVFSGRRKVQPSIRRRDREELHGRGLLHYRKWWERCEADIAVNGDLLTGIPIFVEKNTLRVVNDTYSYFIPLDKVDYIRTTDGLKHSIPPNIGRYRERSPRPKDDT